MASCYSPLLRPVGAIDEPRLTGEILADERARWRKWLIPMTPFRTAHHLAKNIRKSADRDG
jgi:hypothetical protein